MNITIDVVSREQQERQRQLEDQVRAERLRQRTTEEAGARNSRVEDLENREVTNVGWEEEVDPKSGRLFYINHTSKETQWEPPSKTEVHPLVEQLTDGLCIYSQGYWQDFWLQYRNSHILISCFAAHPAHYFTTNERFWVFVVSSFWAFGVSGLFELLVDRNCKGHLENAPIDDFFANPKNCDLHRYLITYVVNAGVQFFYDLIAQFVLTCGCVQQWSDGWRWRKKSIEFLGNICFWLPLLFLAFVSFILGFFFIFGSHLSDANITHENATFVVKLFTTEHETNRTDMGLNTSRFLENQSVDCNNEPLAGFGLVKSGNQVYYKYLCGLRGPFADAVSKKTIDQHDGGGDTQYLEKLDVTCGDGKVLSAFKYELVGNDRALYKFKCVSLTEKRDTVNCSFPRNTSWSLQKKEEGLNFLTSLAPTCDANETMQHFKIISRTIKLQNRTELSYQYKCCKVNRVSNTTLQMADDPSAVALNAFFSFFVTRMAQFIFITSVTSWVLFAWSRASQMKPPPHVLETEKNRKKWEDPSTFCGCFRTSPFSFCGFPPTAPCTLWNKHIGDKKSFEDLPKKSPDYTWSLKFGFSFCCCRTCIVYTHKQMDCPVYNEFHARCLGCRTRLEVPAGSSAVACPRCTLVTDPRANSTLAAPRTPGAYSYTNPSVPTAGSGGSRAISDDEMIQEAIRRSLLLPVHQNRPPVADVVYIPICHTLAPQHVSERAALAEEASARNRREEEEGIAIYGGPPPSRLQYNVPQQQQMGQGGPAGARVYVGGTSPRPSGLMGPNPGVPLSSENLPSVGSEPYALAQRQSSFYQSALRSAERAAAQLQAQRHALEQGDRAAALLAQQAPPTVMRPSPTTSALGQ